MSWRVQVLFSPFSQALSNAALAAAMQVSEQSDQGIMVRGRARARPPNREMCSLKPLPPRQGLQEAKASRRRASRRVDINLDTASIYALISACKKGQGHPKALQHYEHMQRHSINHDTDIDSALISACEKRQSLPKTLPHYEHMQRHSINPDIVTDSALISICEKGQGRPKTLQQYEHMQRHGINPDTDSVSALISACEKWQGCPKALQYYEHMQRHGINNDIVMDPALISTKPLKGLERHVLNLYKV